MISVVGMGQIGVTIAYALGKLGHKIEIVDAFQPNLAAAKSKLLEFDIEVEDRSEPSYTCSTLISACPYYCNFNIAERAIKEGIKYCDLGGNVGVSRRINELAEKNSVQVFTDLGLAPGLVNIVAHQVITENTEWVKMYVGGLPQTPEINRLGYKCTWSVEGLLNEYFDEVEAKVDNEIKIRNGMSDYEIINLNDTLYEAFATSGGLAHSKHEDVPNIEYKTLRYLGHINMILAIRDYFGVKSLKQVIETYCVDKDFKQDVVLLAVRTNEKTTTTTIFPAHGFSAMQVSTAFPTAIIANIMESDGFKKQGPLQYRDIDKVTYHYLLQELKQRFKIL